MPTDQITLKFDAQTSSAATALQELTAPIEKLSASFATLSNSISKDLVSSLKAITTPLHSVSKSFDTLGSGAKNVKNNISEALTALKQISTGGLSSDLGKVIQQFDVLAQSPAAKGFGNIAISMQRLGAGVSAISSATKKHKEFSVSVLEVSRSLKTLITAYEGLGGLGQKFKNVEGVEQFASKWAEGFSQVVPLLSKFSHSIKILEDIGRKKVKVGAIDVSSLRASVTEIISVINTLFSSLGSYGGKTVSTPSKDSIIKQVTSYINPIVEGLSEASALVSRFIGGAFSKSSSSELKTTTSSNTKDKPIVKQVTSYINPLMEGLSEVTNLVSRFVNTVSSAKSKLSGVKPAIEEATKTVDDLISTLGAYMGRTTQSVTVSSKEGSFVKTVTSYINPLMEGLSEVISIVNRFVNTVSSAKSRLSGVKPAIEEAVKIVDNLITTLGSYMGKTTQSVTVSSKEGSFVKTVTSYINPLMEGLSEVTKLVSRFVSTVSSTKDKLSGVKPAIDEAMKTVAELINTLGGYASGTTSSATNSGKKGIFTKQALSFINPLMQGFSEVIGALSRFSSSIARLKKEVNLSDKDIITVKDRIGSLINQLGELPEGKIAYFERLSSAVHNLAEGMKYLRSTTKAGSTVIENANKVLQETSSTAKTTTKSLHWLSGGWKSVVTAFAGGTVIYSTVRFIKEAAAAFVDLDREMRLVNVVVRGTEENLAAMTNEVFNVASQFGLGAQKIAKSLYEINQATIVGADSLEVLRNAAKMAVAGNTDVDKSSKLLAATLKSYAKSVNESSYLTDIFFKIQERGIITIDELTQYGQRLFATFSSAGIPIEEMGAALSTLTTRGLQANIAVTALNSLVLKLSSGNAKLNKIFEMTGDSTSANALRTKGLAYTMQVLQNATNGALSSLTRLGFNYRDIRAATILANDIGGTYAENLAIFSDRTQIAGASQQAYNELLKSFSQQLREIKESLANSITQITNFVGKWTGLTTVIGLLRSFLNSTNPIVAAIRSITSGVLKFVAAITIVTGTIVLVVGLIVKAKAAITTLIHSFVEMIATTKTNTTTLGVFGTGLKTIAGLFDNATNSAREYNRELTRLGDVSKMSPATMAPKLPQPPSAKNLTRTVIEGMSLGGSPLGSTEYVKISKTASAFRKGLLAVRTALFGLVAGVKALIASLLPALATMAVITGVLWALGKAISAIKTARAQKDLESLRKRFEELKIETSNSISIDAKVVGLAQLDALQKKMLEVKAVLGETSPEFRQLQDEMNKFRESLGKVVSATTDAQIQLALDDQAKAITKAWEGSLTSGQRLVILQNDLANAVQKYNELQASKAPAETIAAQIKEVTKLQVAVLGLEQQAINTQQALIRAFSNRFVNIQGTDDLDTYRLKVLRLQSIYKKFSDKGLVEDVDLSAIIDGDYSSVIKSFDTLRKNIDGVALSAQKLAKEGYIDQLRSSLANINVDVNLSAESVTTELASKIRKAVEASNAAAQQYTDLFKKGAPTSLMGALDRAASLGTFYSSRANLMNLVKGEGRTEDTYNKKYYSEIKQDLSTILKLRTRLASLKGDPLSGEEVDSAKKAVANLNKYIKSIDLLGTTRVSPKEYSDMSKIGMPKDTEIKPIVWQSQIVAYDISKEAATVYSALADPATFDKNFLKGFSDFTNKLSTSFNKLFAPELLLPDTRTLSAELDALYSEAQSLATSLPNEEILKNKEALEVWQHAFDRATNTKKVEMLNEKIKYFTDELGKAKTNSEKILIQSSLNKLIDNLEKLNEEALKYRKTVEDSARNLYESSLPAYKREELAKKRLLIAQEKLNKAESSEEKLIAFDEYQKAWKDVIGLVGQVPNLSPEIKTSQAVSVGSQEAYELLRRSEKHDYNLDIAKNTSLIYDYLRKNLKKNAETASITIVEGI